jgi:hypothetical protein
MSVIPEYRHCRWCYLHTDHMRHEDRIGPRLMKVTVTCCECGHTRSWQTGAPYDLRYDDSPNSELNQ